MFYLIASLFLKIEKQPIELNFFDLEDKKYLILPESK
jgi:hypothetical protein